VVTVPVVVLLAGVIAGVVVVAQDGGPGYSPDSGPVLATDASDSPTSTPADQGTPGPTEATSSTSPSDRRPSRRHAKPTPSRSASAPPSATATVCVPQEEQRQLTAVSFNIHSAREHDGRVDLGTIADEIAAMRADVVLLQEVDRGRAWTQRLDMPALLADRLDMSWAFGANVVRSPTNQYGTAILSRYPIVSSRNVLLPDPRGTQQRGLLHAVVDVHGTEVSIYDTHLEATSSAARLQQIRVITPILRADPRPRLFGGDLNSGPASGVLVAARSVLADTWTAVGSGAGLTVPGGAPRIRIDYLLFGDGRSDGGSADLEPLAVQVLPSQVSDHRAVRATYRLTTEGEPVCVPQLG
jgi:endonuclease/exonuclease/phosphatase family metal-dependent hydrolase